MRVYVVGVCGGGYVVVCSVGVFAYIVVVMVVVVQLAAVGIGCGKLDTCAFLEQVIMVMMMCV